MPEQHRVDVAYRLSGPGGSSPGTQHKTWFFDVTTVDWDELLHRVFYDANAGMRRREPRDDSWLALDSYRTSPISLPTMLAWDGEATQDKAAAHLPWILASAAVSWEYTSCYLVDASGAYDGMTGNDFSELVLYRALAEGRATQTQAQDTLAKLYPGHGDAVWSDRRQRIANLVTVRASGAFRRTPGSTPYVSGPVKAEDLL